MNKTLRKTYVYKNYFWDFYNNQKQEVQDKIDYVIGLVRSLQIVPERFLKHLEGTHGVYEIRAKLGSDIYRIFCFFDDDHLIILLNGFQKKKAKTPRQEIARAERLKMEYYENKSKK